MSLKTFQLANWMNKSRFFSNWFIEHIGALVASDAHLGFLFPMQKQFLNAV